MVEPTRGRCYTRRVADLSEVEMLGIMFTSFAGACMNLQFVLGPEAAALLADIDPAGWYPISRYYRIIEIVAHGYTDPGPILERIGADTVRSWYEAGNHARMKRSVDFLALQVGGQAYHSVVRGPRELLGEVRLLALDEAAGRAVVHTTTLVPRALQRGIYLGAFQLCGDVTFVQVDNSRDPDVIEIEFH